MSTTDYHRKFFELLFERQFRDEWPIASPRMLLQPWWRFQGGLFE